MEEVKQKLNLQSLAQALSLACLIVGFFVVQDRRVSRIEYNEEARKTEEQKVTSQRENDIRKIESLTQQLQRLMLVFEELIDETKLPPAKKERLRRQASGQPMKLNGRNGLHANQNLNQPPGE